MKKIFFILLFSFILIIPSRADEIQDEIVSSIEGELSSFESSLPDYIKDYLPDDFFKGDFSTLETDSLNQANIFKFSIDYLLSSLPTVLKSFSSLLLIILIISIFNSIKSSFNSDGIKNAFSICSALCISIAVYSTMSDITTLCSNYINILCNTMTAFTPLMTALYIMTGSISSAAASNTSMMLFLSIVENFVVIGLVPIINISLCFSIASSISSGIDLSGISRVIKNTFTGICIFLMSIFSFIMSFQSVLTQSADSLSLRTARFAIGNFIPVIGGFISDSLKTISSSLSFIKNSCGIIAVVVIALLVLPVIISLLLHRVSFSLLGAISKALGIDESVRIIDEASTLCGFVLAIVSLTSVIFIFAITIFIKASAGG